MLGDELGEIGAVDAPGDVVAGGDREIGAGVVVEADGIVEAGRLRGQLAEAQHRFGRIEEPPARPEPQRRVVPGERGELARIAGLVQGERDDGEVRLVADGVEQGLQRLDIVGRGRDVAAHVAAKLFEQRSVVIAPGAGMDLQHEPVVETHLRHLGQHLAAEQIGILGRDLALEDLGVELFRIGVGEVGGARRGMAMVGRCCAAFLEIAAPLAVGREIAGPGADIFAGQFAELFEILGKALEFRVDDAVGPIGRDDLAAPAGVADHVVPFEIVERAFGRADRLDVEALEQGAGAQLRFFQLGGDLVVDPVGVLGGQPLVDAEDRRGRVLEPQPRRRAAEEVPVAGEELPDLARVGLDRSAVFARDAELLEPHALRIKHAEDVVIWLDEKRRGIGKGIVLGIPARVGVAVRGDDRQVAHRGEEPSCDAAGHRIGGKEAIVVQQHGHLPNE